MKDLHDILKFRDRHSFLYVEHARIEQEAKAIAIHDADGSTAVPVSALAVLMLGPGCSVTHAAVKALGDNNCLVIWCGEENVRFYAAGLGGTRSATRLLRQAQLAADMDSRTGIARRMYAFRFDEPVADDVSIEVLRGREGVRVRETYRALAESTGVEWNGRNYDRTDWGAADPVNRALSSANLCLYGVCHAAILSAGYSPAIGFIHTGDQRSFVFDIADLYKTDIVFPIAFEVAATIEEKVERETRYACREVFRRTGLIKRIIPDIVTLLGDRLDEREQALYDADPIGEGRLWSPTHVEPDETM